MIAPHQILHQAREQGERFPQFVPSLGRSISTDDVIDLIESCTSPAAQRGARELLRRMADGPWRVVAAVHANQNDKTPHVTVEVRKTRFHLRLDARHCIFDITWEQHGALHRLSGNLPWEAPGSNQRPK